MTIWRGEGGGGDATTDSEINFITSLTNSIAADTALTSANAAAVTSLYDSFDDRYLGPKTAAPTLDNDGNALISGALYWNTTSNQMFVWSGVAWQQTFFSGTNVRSVFTATASQTVFTVPSYTTSNNTIQVYVNGFKVISGTDYTETNTTTITFTSGLTLGDEVEVIIAQPFSVGTTSSDAVNYLPAGTGAVSATVQTKLRESVSVQDFGALGNGTTDDTAAIQAALTTGKDVFVPGVSSYYKITAALSMSSNQRLYGEGRRSQIRQATTQLNAITATSTTGSVIDSISVYAAGTKAASLSSGCGIYFASCTAPQVRNTLVQNHLGSGVNFQNCNDGQIVGNTFLNSPATDGMDNTQCGEDIRVGYSSSRNIVSRNNCQSGNGTGIIVQSITTGDTCDDNVVADNIVLNCKAYGIVIYNNDSAYPRTLFVRRAVVSNNTVKNVTGTILNATALNYSFGAGIYIQGSEETVVIGNTIRQTHSGAVTFSQLLAPGAIGVTNEIRVSITGNVIEQAGMFGIDIGDGNVLGEPIGAGSITGNIISNCQLSGINVRNRGRLALSNNTIDTTGLTSTGSGVRINSAASTAYPDISITGNLIRNSATGATANIEVNYVNGLTVSGNICDTSVTHGIAISNSSNASVAGNTVKNHTSRGIQIVSTSSAVTLTGNTVVGTGSSSVGIQLDAFTALDAANYVTGCTNAWSGNYAVLRGTQNSTAVSNSGAAETDLMTYVLPASSMTLANDALRVTAWGICANNANAKTIKVYFGTTLLQTVSLTTSQAGAWRIQAEMVATGSAAQRCFSQLVQGGTVTFVAASYTSAAETSSAAITVKVTGTGVASSDITQDGMLVQFAKG